MRITYPRVKLLVSLDFKVLGAHFVGPDSATLVHQVMTLIAANNDVLCSFIPRCPS